VFFNNFTRFCDQILLFLVTKWSENELIFGPNPILDEKSLFFLDQKTSISAFFWGELDDLIVELYYYYTKKYFKTVVEVITCQLLTEMTKI